MHIGEVYRVLIGIPRLSRSFKPGDIITIIEIISTDRYKTRRISDGLELTLLPSTIELNCVKISNSSQDAHYTGLAAWIPTDQSYTSVSNIGGFFPSAGTEDREPCIEIAKPKCECGVSALGLDKHSDYCQLYKKD